MANKRGNAGQPLPLSDRDDDHMQGHWLLARLGKRVLRPGASNSPGHCWPAPR